MIKTITLFLAIAAACSATIVINTDQSASGSLGTVDFTDNPSCNPCFGETDGKQVQFDGIESLLANGGQSRIESIDGLFTSMQISVPGFAFDRLVFRLFGPGANGQSVAIVAEDTAGLQFAAVLPLGNNPSGEFFNVQSDAGQQIKSVSFQTSGNGVEDLRQVRVGGFTNDGSAAVPEPVTYLLTGAGLMGLSLIRRLKTR